MVAARPRGKRRAKAWNTRWIIPSLRAVILERARFRLGVPRVSSTRRRVICGTRVYSFLFIPLFIPRRSSRDTRTLSSWKASPRLRGWDSAFAAEKPVWIPRFYGAVAWPTGRYRAFYASYVVRWFKSLSFSLCSFLFFFFLALVNGMFKRWCVKWSFDINFFGDENSLLLFRSMIRKDHEESREFLYEG